MRALALLVLLALPAAAQSNGVSLGGRVVEVCEGQVCYLRCSGAQRLVGTLTVSGVVTASRFVSTANSDFSLEMTGTDPYIYASNANANIYLVSAVSAGNAGSTCATSMLCVRPTGALDAGDWVFSVADAALTSLLSVAYTGVVTVATQLNTPSLFLSGGGSSAADVGTDPTVVACSGTAASITAANGTAAVQFDVGTSCAGESTAVLTLPAATTGWVCSCSSTTADRIIQQKVMPSASTTTVTLQNIVISTGANGDFADGADVACLCRGL